MPVLPLPRIDLACPTSPVTPEVVDPRDSAECLLWARWSRRGSCSATAVRSSGLQGCRTLNVSGVGLAIEVERQLLGIFGPSHNTGVAHTSPGRDGGDRPCGQSPPIPSAAVVQVIAGHSVIGAPRTASAAARSEQRSTWST